MAPIRSTSGSRCARGGRTPVVGAWTAGAALLVLLLLLGCCGGDPPYKLNYAGFYTETKSWSVTADDISYCLNAWVAWLDAEGTYLCPTNLALDSFAQQSGYDSFPDLAALWVAGASKKSLASLPEGMSQGVSLGPGQEGDATGAAAPAQGPGSAVGARRHRRRRLKQSYPLDPPLFVQRFFQYLTLQPAERSKWLDGCSDAHLNECALTGYALYRFGDPRFLGNPAAHHKTRLPTYSCLDADPFDTSACDDYERLVILRHDVPTSPGSADVFATWGIPLLPALDGPVSGSYGGTLFAYPANGSTLPYTSLTGVNLAPNLAWRMAQRIDGSLGPAVVHGIRAISFNKDLVLPYNYLLPPRTFHTLAEALTVGGTPFVKRGLLHAPLNVTWTRKFLSKYLSSMTTRPALSGTLFAPTDKAWLTAAYQAPYNRPGFLPADFAAFAGMPNLLALVIPGNRAGMSALLKYHFVRGDPLDWRKLMNQIALSSGRYTPFSFLQVANPDQLTDNTQVTETVVLRTSTTVNSPYDYCAVGLRQLGPPPAPGTLDQFWDNYDYCSGIINSYKQEFWGGGVVIQQIDGLPLLPWLFGVQSLDGNRTWIGDPTPMR